MPFDINAETLFFLVAVVLTFLYQVYKRFAEPKERLDQTEENEASSAYEPHEGFDPYDPFSPMPTPDKEVVIRAEKTPDRDRNRTGTGEVVLVDIGPKSAEGAMVEPPKQPARPATQSTIGIPFAGPASAAPSTQKALEAIANKSPWQRAFLYSEILGKPKSLQDLD